MGVLYHRPDGRILAWLPGHDRDAAFERHLHRQDIPFIVSAHEELTAAPPLDRGADGNGAVAHVRTTHKREADGSLSYVRHLHHADGRQLLELDGEEDASNA